jgi:hypothetical protein
MPTEPLGRIGGVVKASAAATVSVNAFVEVTDALSVTCAVNRKLPELAGNPLISPVEELSVKPPGSDPALTLKV